jgi:SHAQKYF class myb-like DNA-binding protein
MEPGNFYDCDSNNQSSQQPQHTQFLDLTNGEGGERKTGVTMAYRDDSYVPSNNTSNTNRSITASISSLRTSTSFPRGSSGHDASNFLGGKLDPNTPGRVVETGQEHTGRWTKEEHEAFLIALKTYGKEWKKVAAKVKTRTVVQTRTHAQKYFQKLSKANEGKEDVTHVDMGTASEARRGGSALNKKKPRLGLSTSNKIPRTASVASAAKVITTIKQHPLPPLALSRPLEVSSGGHGFQTATGTGNGSKVVAGISSQDCSSMYQPTHGFSSTFANSSVSEPRPTSTQSTTVNDAMMGGNNFLRGKPLTIGTSSFPSMKIVAPEHDYAIKQGKFPEPSPAACGKRKLAEIAAARMLAGVAASESLLTPSQSLTNSQHLLNESGDIKRNTAPMSHHVHNTLGNVEDGMATPPPEEMNVTALPVTAFKSSMAHRSRGTVPSVSNNIINGPSQFLTGVPKKTMGLSLQIVNPESLGVSCEEIVGRKNDGQMSPVTPWEGQLQALVR